VITFGSRLKLASLTRTVAAQETVHRAKPLAKSLGVTRLADVTGLDRVGIPVFSAIVPDSDDTISVYSGKGSHRADAMAGALMEAVERQVTIRARPKTIRASTIDLRRHASILDPEALISSLAEDYDESRIYEWIEGYDLLNGRLTLVPAHVAGYRWSWPRCGSPLLISTTHGLSSGNCLEEAISQSICEWIERDAWTLAELASHWRPRALREYQLRRDPGDDFVDDLERCPCIDFSGIGEEVEALLRRFHRAGFSPIVRDISSDLGIPVVLATVTEDDIPDFPQAHMGVGAHPDLRVAAIRALTEAAQSRAADIQGVREDLSLADEPRADTGVATHTKRTKFIDQRRWLHAPSRSRRLWSKIQEHRNLDIRDDILLLLRRLRAAGVQQAVMVDLSPPDSGVFVVRLLVTGLEMWIADGQRIGERAAAYWRGLNRNGK